MDALVVYIISRTLDARTCTCICTSRILNCCGYTREEMFSRAAEAMRGQKFLHLLHSLCHFLKVAVRRPHLVAVLWTHGVSQLFFHPATWKCLRREGTLDQRPPNVFLRCPGEDARTHSLHVLDGPCLRLNPWRAHAQAAPLHAKPHPHATTWPLALR